MRGLWSGALFLVVAIASLTVSLVVVLTVPRLVDGESVVGAGAAAQEQPVGGVVGKDPVLDSIGIPPAELWKTDTRAVLGPEASPGSLGVLAANSSTIIVGTKYSQEGTVAALDPANGAVRWRAKLAADKCALSLDNELGCVMSLRSAATTGNQQTVTLLDGRSGEIRKTKTDHIDGTASIVTAGNGFLVAVRPGNSGPGDTTLTWYASDATKTWTAKVPMTTDPLVSSTGNVVVMADDSAVYAIALDSGKRVYESTADVRAFRGQEVGDAAAIDIAAVAHADGLIVGLSTSTTAQLLLYDAAGHEKTRLTGYRLSAHPIATEGHRVPVLSQHSSLDDSIGVVFTDTGRVGWDKSAGDALFDVALLGPGFVLARSLGEGHTSVWVAYDLENGTPGGPMVTSIYMDPVAYDGTRIVFEGLRASNEPYPGGLTTFDVASGREVWRIPLVGYQVDVTPVGPFLLRTDSKAGGFSRLA